MVVKNHWNFKSHFAYNNDAQTVLSVPDAL